MNARTPLPIDLHFGGPDQPVGALRDVLQRRIEGVPPGGRIDWVTYYFRDRRLAGALIDARQRGVQVSLTLARHTRTPRANADVVALLTGPNGLGSGLRLHPPPGLRSIAPGFLRSRLHEKLYCFSHPSPVALIGSFNPSSDVPELHPDVIAEIGDHDRAWNALVPIEDPLLVAALADHARRLHAQPPGLFHRFGAEANRPLHSGGTTVYFWPRRGRHPVLERLDAVGATAHVRIAASHLSARPMIDALVRLAARGVRVEIAAEPTLRRVTPAAERRLLAAGVRLERLMHDSAPMHLKFVLVEDGFSRWVAFGSFNWTLPSMVGNHEIAAISQDGALFDAFSGRWNALQRALDADRRGSRPPAVA